MAAIEILGCPKPLLTEKQIRALAVAASTPLSRVNEVRLSTGFRVSYVRQARHSLETRGLVDHEGRATDLGVAVLAECRPAHVVAA